MSPRPNDKTLILASASPRRAALLREHGYTVRVIPPPLEEPVELSADLPPARTAEALSYFKAKSVADRVPDNWILAGDTIVTLGERIFGKPESRDGARAMVLSLLGTTHDVITGVTLLHARSGRRVIRHDVTSVTMRTMTPDELDAYLAGGAWAGKSGAYGIQDHGDAFVESYAGSFTNVVGLPMELVTNMLGNVGFLAEE